MASTIHEISSLEDLYRECHHAARLSENIPEETWAAIEKRIFLKNLKTLGYEGDDSYCLCSIKKGSQGTVHLTVTDNALGLGIVIEGSVVDPTVMEIYRKFHELKTKDAPSIKQICEQKLVQEARNRVDHSITTHSSSKLVNKSNAIIPHSDMLAVYRNGFKLAISVIGLVLIALALAGTLPLWSMVFIAIGICALAIVALAILVKNNLISESDAIKLGIMVVVTTVTGLFGGNYLLLAGYAASVIIQGFLFAGPQGLAAWGKGNVDKFKIAHEAGDNKHMLSAALGVNSGVLSAVEGSTWVFMGILLLTAALSHFIPGVPALLPNVLPYVTAGLFFGVFNVGYVFMMGTGIRDLRIQNKFHDGLTKVCPKVDETTTRKQCLDALQYIRRKMTGKEKIPPDLESPQKQELMKKLLRLSKVMDDKVFNLLTIENIDKLIFELKEEIKKLENNQKLVQKENHAFEICKTLIKDIISANERNITLSKSQIKIAVAGFIIGTALSLFEEFTNSGSVIHMPFIGGVTNLHQNALDSLSLISTILDCGFWAFINYLFKRCLDDPAGRSDDEKRTLNRVAEYLMYPREHYPFSDVEDKEEQKDQPSTNPAVVVATA